MANTVTYGPGKITIVPDGATVFDSSLLFPNGLRVGSIMFVPSAVNDVLEVRHGSATGTVMCRMISVSGDVLEDHFSALKKWKPYIKAAGVGENVWGTPANVKIMIEYL
jgi:hypothetical protein